MSGRNRIWNGTFALLVALSAGRAFAQYAEPAPRDAFPSATTRPSRDPLLHQAWDNLVNGRYSEAVHLFNAVLRTAPTDFSALEGRGICEYELSDGKAAAADTEAALRRIGGAPPYIRQGTIAAAVAAIQVGNPIRAVRLAYDALRRTDADHRMDEEMQNLLGTALWRMPREQILTHPWLIECGRYYLDYDARLAEARHPKTSERFV